MKPTTRSEKGFPTDPVLALRTRELLSEARRLVAAEKWREAAPLSATLVQTAPGLAEGHEIMGVVAFKTGAATIAEKCFEQAVRIGPATSSRLLYWAKALLAMDDAAAAEKVLHRALLIRADDPVLLANLGDTQLSLGKQADALKSFRRVLKRQPDYTYAQHMVSALSHVGVPDRTYVAGLFDDYAGIFDEHLTGALGYKVPQALADVLKKHRPSLGSAIDIGCGTGLVAVALEKDVEAIDGIDIAPRMIEKARERHLYRNLAVGDAAEVLAHDPRFAGPYGLAVAADVFIYIGDIDALMAAIVGTLAPDGLIAFSVETSDDAEIEIRASGRFAHSQDYIALLADRHALAIVEQAGHVIRLENNRPIHGALYILKPR